MTPGHRNKGRVVVARHCLGLAGLVAGLLMLGSGAAEAAPVANPVATFSGLDKITARLTNFDAYVGETVQFGSLQITPRVCYTRPADETQRTSVFVEVDQVSLTGANKRLFTGWMFADSPALNAVDDPVYDFWLVDCKQHSDVPPPKVTNPVPGPVEPPPASSPPDDDATPPTPTPDDSADVPDPTAAPVEKGSFITLLNPKPAAEISPDQ